MNISPELVRELLDYNPETGVFTWRHRSSEHFSAPRYAASWNTRYAGHQAGAIFQSTKDSYRRVVISVTVRGKSVSHSAHRLAWMHFYGEQPPEMIDHINRDSTDNRISNLRAADHSLNAWNKNRPTHNTSGIVGVYREKGKWWSARVSANNGKTLFLGYFGSKQDAAEKVAEFRESQGLPMHNHSHHLRR